MSQPHPRRNHPLGDVPTLKITAPAPGHPPAKTDEWCFAYLSQSSAGRVLKQAPYVRSICFRKVFLHEVRNVLSTKKHDNVGPDGRARYPLPPVLRDPAKTAGAESPTNPPTTYWKEGWYLWKGKGVGALLDKMTTMHMDLKDQHKYAVREEKRRHDWLVHRNSIKHNTPTPNPNPLPPQTALRVFPEADNTTLVPVQFELPSIFHRINETLEPARRALEVTHENVTSGELFTLLKDKALSREPFDAAKRALSIAYQRVKDLQPSTDAKQGPSDPKKGTKT